jgi:hypothetical protein
MSAQQSSQRDKGCGNRNIPTHRIKSNVEKMCKCRQRNRSVGIYIVQYGIHISVQTPYFIHLSFLASIFRIFICIHIFYPFNFNIPWVFPLSSIFLITFVFFFSFPSVIFFPAYDNTADIFLKGAYFDICTTLWYRQWLW